MCERKLALTKKKGAVYCCDSCGAIARAKKWADKEGSPLDESSDWDYGRACNAIKMNWKIKGAHNETSSL